MQGQELQEIPFARIIYDYLCTFWQDKGTTNNRSD